MSTKVTIAIPTYNRPGYLKECIQSVLDQTLQDFSIVVFDNASTEPVEEEVQKFKDPRIRFFGNKENIGAAGNINRILRHSFESEYVIIFHDDDTMHPKMLELQAAFLDAHKDIQFVLADLNRSHDNTMRDFAKFAENNIRHTMYREKYEFIRAQMNWLRYPSSSALYRAEVLQGMQMKFERFSDFADMAFLAEMSEKGVCAFLAAALINYRIHAGQDSEDFKRGYKEGMKELLSFYKERLLSTKNKADEKLFRAYSLNLLLRSCAHVNNGFLDSLQFLKESHEQKLIQYRDFVYIDARGVVSLASILFKSRKVIDTARWLRNLFQ